MAKPRKTLDSWIADQLSVKDEEDKHVPLVMLSIVHVQGQTELELKHTKLNQAKQYTGSELADIFMGVADAYSQDLPGAQFFKVYAFHGESKTPTAIHPVRVAGQTGPDGGLVTEAPTAEGRMMQKMRHEEGFMALIFRQTQVLFDASSRMIATLGENNAKLQHETNEAYEIVREMSNERIELGHDKRMKELEFERSTAERQKLMKALPVLANQITGRNIFPQETEDTALVEMLAAAITEDQVKMVAAALPPEVAGLLMQRFKVALERTRKEKEAVEAISKEQAEKATAAQLQQTNGNGATDDADGMH